MSKADRRMFTKADLALLDKLALRHAVTHAVAIDETDGDLMYRANQAIRELWIALKQIRDDDKMDVVSMNDLARSVLAAYTE